MIQEKKKHKKTKKPSAMAQVHNKVNAGVMDGVVYGGMMEAAEPEDEEYEIGLEEGGMEPYGHAVNESTDCVRFDGYHFDCYDRHALPFMSLVRKDGSKGTLFVGPVGGLHGGFETDLYASHKITPDEYGRPSELKIDGRRTGRFWFDEGVKIISFYSYPDNPKQIYDNCVEALLAIQKEIGEDFNIGEVMVDLWTKSVKNTVIMPVRWFNNGMADTFLPIVRKCEPYEDFDGSFRYRIETVKGNFTADWKGDDIEEEQGYGALRESKETGKKVDYNKYIKSLIDFMREQHLRIDPLPEIELNPEEQDGIFVKTGYYSPEEKKVVVFTDGRHPKDVLRTVAHEFIHHMQNLQNPNKDWGTGGDLEADRKLRGIEGEAFLLGNIIFREWTEKMKKTKELNESKAKVFLNESHYDEYYHFTEMDNLISLLRDGKFYFAGSDKNPRTSQYAKLENGFRGGKNGYLSLTRMRNIEQGYQYEQSKNRDAFARITFDGNVLNNLRDVQIKPLDFIYNWNQKTPYFQDYTPTALSPGSNGGSKRTRFFAQGKNGKGLYNDTDFNKDWSEYYGNGKNGERFRENIRRQFQNQAEESLVLNNEKGMMDANEMKAAIKRIDILILNPGKGFTPEYIIKNYGLDSCWAKDRIFIYPLQSKTYFNLGKNKGCINVAEYLESKEHDDYWDNYISIQGALKESKGRLNEIEAEIVEPDDVDLSSFNIKKHLNPKFWDDGHLDTRIRLRLLDIADDFFHFLDVDWVEPEDIIITGSLANYNWNKKYSDIDLHILIDYEDVDERVDFVREYFTMKKNEWNEKHKSLRIFGFPVEVYVQDANEPHASSGVYSVDRDKWLTEPDLDNLRSGKVDKRHVREMVSTYMNKIDDLVDIYKRRKDDEYEMRKVSEDAARMFDEIKKTRKDDLARYGREMCDGNIIFKALRRSDYIGKLIKLKNLTYDKINSL